MQKRFTKEVESNEVKHQILIYLSQYLTVSQIAKQRKTSRTAVYKVLNKLKGTHSFELDVEEFNRILKESNKKEIAKKTHDFT